jgi:hypothetical protein
MTASNDGTGFEKIFDDGGDMLGRVYGTARVVVSFLEINRRVRP